MCVFRKTKVADKLKDDRLIIETNSKSIDALVVLAKENIEIVNELRDLQEELKYLIPSHNTKIVDYDKAIKNKIGDLRIALVKSNGEVTKKINEIIIDIKLAVADRNVKL